MKKIVSFVVGLSMTLSLGAGFTACERTAERAFDNIILVIGDGMGENHILNAIDYFDLETPVFIADQKGYINTNSLSGTTDSAAGATALATGKKVVNGNIAQYEGKDLKQITTIAQGAKMKTGVITTDTLDGATPAGFSAHAPARNFTNTIMETQAKSGIDLLLGRKNNDYVYNSDYFTDKGYTFTKTEEELFAAKNSDKLVGVLTEINSEYIIGEEEDFQLKEMAQFAVEYLENDGGFFLMIEGAYIDKYSHNNDFNSAMCEMRSLIDTIEFLYEYASDGKTAIFITADHETGDLSRPQEGEALDSFLYHSEGHTATPVPLYVKNYAFNAEKFGYAAGVPENTVVFEACKAIIKGK